MSSNQGWRTQAAAAGVVVIVVVVVVVGTVCIYRSVVHALVLLLRRSCVRSFAVRHTFIILRPAAASKPNLDLIKKNTHKQTTTFNSAGFATEIGFQYSD